MFRNHCFPGLFGPQSCSDFLAHDSSHSQPLGSDLILHQQMCHINVLETAKSLSVGGGCVRWPSQHWPALAPSHNPDSSTTTQILSTQTHPLLQHETLLLRCFLQCYSACACVLSSVCLPNSMTPTLDDLRDSWHPAQSESLFRSFFNN